MEKENLDNLIISVNQMSKIIQLYKGKGMPIEMIEKLVKFTDANTYHELYQNSINKIILSTIDKRTLIFSPVPRICYFCGSIKNTNIANLIKFYRNKEINDNFLNVYHCDNCYEKIVSHVNSILMDYRKIFCKNTIAIYDISYMRIICL